MLCDELLCQEENALLSPCSPPGPHHASFVELDLKETFRMLLAHEAHGGRLPRNDQYLHAIQRHGMEAAWRRKITHWMFETGKAFELTKDTVGCAVFIMDQYLSVMSVDKILLQLLSMVCMYVASKMHESQPISMEEMDLLSQRKFSRQDVCRMEAQLLQLIKWKLNPPTCFSFARDFMGLVDIQDDQQRQELEDEVMDFLQDVTEDYSSVRYKSSSVGVAGVYVVWKARRFGSTSQLQEVLHTFDEFPMDEFVDCYRLLLELYQLKYCPSAPSRFVSVEESKVESTCRAISPTSVDDTAALASDAAVEAHMVELAQNSSHDHPRGQDSDASAPATKRARHNSVGTA
ncbi:TPA: hypothetical protein N0F65_007115 [Lagenidium giganteum]|uniref:Cyclin-like domain-containing protein n=1 Tax=Lagenidium giganteum TaxID=4803 RepID=A0AAV2YQN5_9STRA|nr:TPA: hypothetical protein N0F65_007115 [Lagenidium giganteum]